MASRRAAQAVQWDEKKMMKHKAKAMISLGIGVFIFGLVKYLGYSWEIAFMTVGVLAVLKGLWIWSKK